MPDGQSGFARRSFERVLKIVSMSWAIGAAFSCQEEVESHRSCEVFDVILEDSLSMFERWRLEQMHDRRLGRQDGDAWTRMYSIMGDLFLAMEPHLPRTIPKGLLDRHPDVLSPLPDVMTREELERYAKLAARDYERFCGVASRGLLPPGEMKR